MQLFMSLFAANFSLFNGGGIVFFDPKKDAKEGGSN